MDPLALRGAFGKFATGITIITGDDRDGRPFGLTVNSFSSLSLDPPLLLWNLQKNSDCLPHFERQIPFAVNVLEESQQAIAQALSKKNGHSLENLDWERREGGLPVLKGALACFECRHRQSHEGGDHLIIVGEIEGFRVAEGEPAPLLFFSGKYRRLQGD